MSEQLVIEVDARTAEAVANMNRMADVVRQNGEIVAALAAVVGRLDATLARLATTEGTATRSTEGLADATGELREDALRAAAGLDAMGRETAELAGDMTAATRAATAEAGAIDHVEEAMREAALESGRMAQQTVVAGRAAEQAAPQMHRAGDAAEGAGRRTVTAADAFNLLTRSAAAFGIGGFGAFEVLNRYLAKMREDAEAAVKAIVTLGGRQREFDNNVADIQDNLRLFGDGGVDRTRKLVTNYMVATGTTVGQAKELIAAANPSYPVLDQNAAGQPVNKGNLDIVEEVGKFAGRTRLDDATAGNLFKLLEGENAKNVADVRRVLSQLEAGANQVKFVSPKDVIGQLVELQAGQVKGTLADTIGDFAAASQGNVKATLAGTNVGQFRKVFRGTDSTLPTLGRLALEQGTLTAQQVADETPASAKAAEFARRRSDLDAKDAKGDVAYRRKLEDLERDQAALVRQQEALTAFPTSRAYLGMKDEGQRSRRLAEMQAAYDKAKTDVERRTADLAASPNSTANDRARLAEAEAKDAAERMNKGLAAAYQKLGEQKQYAFGRSLYAGKTSQQQALITAGITEGDEGFGGIKAVLSPVNAAAGRQAVTAANAAKPSDVVVANNDQMRNSAAGRTAVQEAKLVQQDVNGRPGAMFAAGVEKWMEEDRAALATQDIPGSTWTPWTSNTREMSLYAFTGARRDAQRKAAYVLSYWQSLVAGLPPQTRAAIGEQKLGQIDRYVAGVYDLVVNQGLDQSTAAARITTMAETVGEFERYASGVASSRRESLPMIALPKGKAMLPNVDQFTGKAAASPTVQPVPSGDPFDLQPPAIPAAPRPATPSAAATGAAMTPPTTGQQPQAANTTINNYTYTTQVGSYYGLSGSGYIDLPGPLGRNDA